MLSPAPASPCGLLPRATCLHSCFHLSPFPAQKPEQGFQSERLVRLSACFTHCSGIKTQGLQNGLPVSGDGRPHQPLCVPPSLSAHLSCARLHFLLLKQSRTRECRKWCSNVFHDSGLHGPRWVVLHCVEPAGATVSALVTPAAVGGGAVVAGLSPRVPSRAADLCVGASGSPATASQDNTSWYARASSASGCVLRADVSWAKADGVTQLPKVGGAGVPRGTEAAVAV